MSTVWEGTNTLVGINEIEHEVEEILKGNGKKGKVPDLWDGKAAARVVEVLEKILEKTDDGGRTSEIRGWVEESKTRERMDAC